MRKAIIGAAVLTGAVTGAVLAARRFGPRLAKSAMAHCEAMFEHMPEDFPPKKMMRSLEETRQQNTKILEHLEAKSERPLAAVS